MKPLVLHVISSDARRGAEVFAHELAQALHEDVRAEVVALQASGASSTLPVSVLGRSWRSIASMRALRTCIRAADVVVAHGSITLPAVVLASTGLGVPMIYKNIGDPWYWTNNLRRRLQTSILLRRMTFVAALTQSSAAAVAACWRVPRSRIVVTGGGRDGARFHPASPGDQQQARRDLGLPEDAQVALYVGALALEKRPELAVRAALATPDLHLLLAGDGPERSAIEELARGSERILVLGSRSDVPRLLAACDLVLLTSESEGLPGVLIEAGLSGRPSVAADVGYVADVVVDGETGAVVRSNDPLEYAARTMEALQHRVEWGRAARARCLELFEISGTRRRWLEVMLRAAESRQRRRRPARADHPSP